MGCIAVKPIVDGIERDYAGKVLVLRVDVQSDIGKELAREQSIIATPTFIFFDGQGETLWRSLGMIRPEQVKESLK